MEMPSCNAFVVLPPFARDGSLIFGKNSHRPRGEVQELIYEPPKKYSSHETLKCTYIEVDQVNSTYGVILSKPAWMWGCEMGANDEGVVIGNTTIRIQAVCDENKKGLSGSDLARLALERCKTSAEGVSVITDLIAQHGQHIEAQGGFNYCSSFLLADINEAWILETVGVHWVAQKVTSGFRNISNFFSIGGDIDKMSEDVKNFAKEKGFWDGDGDFNFASVYSEISKADERFSRGNELVEKISADNNFGLKNMFDILRKDEFCKGAEDAFPTAGSQVSLLLKNKPCCHWFTATPDPRISVFKPFIFTPSVKISLHTISPVPNDLARVEDEESFDRRHGLYKLHANVCSNSDNKIISLLQEMEKNCLEEVEKFVEDFQPGQSLTEVDELLKDVVETEVKFYK